MIDFVKIFNFELKERGAGVKEILKEWNIKYFLIKGFFVTCGPYGGSFWFQKVSESVARRKRQELIDGERDDSATEVEPLKPDGDLSFASLEEKTAGLKTLRSEGGDEYKKIEGFDDDQI